MDVTHLNKQVFSIRYINTVPGAILDGKSSQDTISCPSDLNRILISFLAIDNKVLHNRVITVNCEARYHRVGARAVGPYKNRAGIIS